MKLFFFFFCFFVLILGIWFQINCTECRSYCVCDSLNLLDFIFYDSFGICMLPTQTGWSGKFGIWTNFRWKKKRIEAEIVVEEVSESKILWNCCCCVCDLVEFMEIDEFFGFLGDLIGNSGKLGYEELYLIWKRGVVEIGIGLCWIGLGFGIF